MERFGPGAGAKLCEKVRHARRDSSFTGLLIDAILKTEMKVFFYIVTSRETLNDNLIA